MTSSSMLIWLAEMIVGGLAQLSLCTNGVEACADQGIEGNPMVYWKERIAFLVSLSVLVDCSQNINAYSWGKLRAI